MRLCMNWKAISFDWNQSRAFLAVVDTGSLSAAARELGQTQPTLGRQISALEEALGITLFERAGRSLRVTQTGLDLAEHVRTMAVAAAQVSLIASGQSQDVAGVVRVSASDVFAVHLLPPVLEHLRNIAPGLQIDVLATNDISDLLHREADIAIRHVRPEQPDLIARKIHDAKAAFFAATSYLDRRGRPAQLADLGTHDFVSFGDVQDSLDYFRPLGFDIGPQNFKMISRNGLVAWELVKQGFGIAPMSIDVGRKSEGVEVVLPQLDPIVFPVWMVTHRELNTSKRIRLVFDTFAEMLPQQMA